MKLPFIFISEKSLNSQEVIDLVESENAGAVAVFIGTVRNYNLQKKVVRLDYEAYLPMALRKMEELAQAACARFPIEKVAIHHRVGSLTIGEVAVVIAVSTPHRRESFAACQYLIDTLKEIVPIWKKEYYEDGAVWIAAHP
jgi:molybdopterin synthase catalytic subunit